MDLKAYVTCTPSKNVVLQANDLPFLMPSSCDFRSARAEAGRPNPAEAEPHGSDHLHTGGGQTKRRQVHDKVSYRGFTVQLVSGWWL